MSNVLSLNFGWCFIVLAAFTLFLLVSLNNFVTIVVSGPLYVKVAHFVFCVSCGILVGHYIFVSGMVFVVGTPCMIIRSWSLLSLVIGYMFIRLVT
jgi:hypothetical protein